MPLRVFFVFYASLACLITAVNAAGITNANKEVFIARPASGPVLRSRRAAWEANIFFGTLNGALSPPVARTTEGEDVRIETGGGTSFGLEVNAPLSPFLLWHNYFGWRTGGFNMDVSGAGGSFSVFFMGTGLSVSLRLGRFFNNIVFFQFGPAAGYYIKPVLQESFPGGNGELRYRNSMSADLVIGIPFVQIFPEWLFYLIEFRYSVVRFPFEGGRWNDTELVPGNTKLEWRELDGSGYGLYLGVGIRI